tara:strand:- start:446 stop:1363 length:918 start_codon:yes stop_codon:yes gene_type:complete
MSKINATLWFRGNYGPDEVQGTYPCWPNDHFIWKEGRAAGEDKYSDHYVNGSSGYGEEKYLEVWNDDCTQPWFEESVRKSNAKYKIMVLMEPRKLCPHNYEWVAKNHHMFDYVFTTYPDLNNVDKKYRYYHGGCRSYIRPEERGLHTKTKSLACIMSWKQIMPGHQLRHQLKQWVFDNNLNDRIDYNNPPMDDKIAGLRDYRFELVIENEVDSFFSEKLVDSMVSGCIPVYWTNDKDTVLNIFDQDGIIKFDDPSEFCHMLNDNIFTEELYLSKIEAVKNNLKIAEKYASFGNVLWESGLKEILK